MYYVSTLAHFNTTIQNMFSRKDAKTQSIDNQALRDFVSWWF
jgi:hypothetical protein